MVDVRLAQDWTDAQGVAHEAGETVDVDAATLAKLQAEGVVHEDWVGATGTTEGTTDGGAEGSDWVGATGTTS